MFNIFGSNKGTDARDLEKVIFDVAENHKDVDFHVLYKLLNGKEVFIPIDKSSVPSGASPGVKYTTTSRDKLVMKNVVGPNNQSMAFAATKDSCPMLKDGYVGMDWVDFLKMVLKIEGMYGALLQGETSWVGFDKERINYILNTYKA